MTIPATLDTRSPSLSPDAVALLGRLVLIVLIIAVSVGINALLGRWEQTLMRRRGLA